MSLVSTFVELNGVWLKNPTVRSVNADWFLCFDDREPPEVVIKQESIKDREGRSWEELKSCIVVRLAAAGITIVPTSKIHRAQRIFIKEWEKVRDPFTWAYTLFVDIEKFYPNHLAYIENDGILHMDDIDRPEGVYYSPNRRGDSIERSS